MLLSQLPKGCRAQITSFQEGLSSLSERLKVLGFEKDLVVEVLHYGFPSHDPIAVRLGDHMVAIGKEEAKHITVQKI